MWLTAPCSQRNPTVPSPSDTAQHPALTWQLTAVELAALKQLNRGQTLYLMDQSGETAKAGEQGSACRSGAGAARGRPGLLKPSVSVLAALLT